MEAAFGRCDHEAHTILPEMPALATADQAPLSRSQASMTHMMRTVTLLRARFSR